MTNRTTSHLTRTAFADALEIYGADRTRWPIDVRAGANSLLAADPEAQRLYDEAAALDRMLDAAPLVDRARVDLLVNRIVAAAERTPRIAASNASVARTDSRPANELPSPGRHSAKRPFAGLMSALRTQGTAALAASLMLGLLVGGSGVSAPLMTALEDLTGLHLGQDAHAIELARIGGETHDEDL